MNSSFLNDDVTKLSERLKKVGMEKVFLKKDEKASHGQCISNVDDELKNLNNE